MLFRMARTSMHRILRLASGFAGLAALTLLCSSIYANPATAHAAHGQAAAIHAHGGTVKAHGVRVSKQLICPTAETADSSISALVTTTQDPGTEFDCVHAGGYSSCCGAGCHSAMSAAADVALDAPEGDTVPCRLSSDVLAASVVFGLERPPKQ